MLWCTMKCLDYSASLSPLPSPPSSSMYVANVPVVLWQGDEVPRVLQHVHWLHIHPVFIWWVWQGQDARDIATREEQSTADWEHTAQSYKQWPQQWVIDCFILLCLRTHIHEQLLPREHVPKTYCPWPNLYPGQVMSKRTYSQDELHPLPSCTHIDIVLLL